MRLTAFYRFSISFVAVVYGFQSNELYSADEPIAQAPAGQGLPSVSQTVISNSFESVEMEKLRIAKEVGKLSVDDGDFNVAVIKLQKKLAESSLLSIVPPSVPSELRTFLNAGAAEVERSKFYYTQLASVLNNLSPASPYNSGTRLDTVNPRVAADLLHKLANYEEDEGQSQTILNQWGAKEGGARDDARRVYQINLDIQSLSTEQKRLEWNYKMTYYKDAFTGKQSGTEADRTQITEQIQNLRTKIAELQSEQKTRTGLATIPLRKLEFQQFILQLAVQQRYLHALIACGFYRNVFAGGDMSIKQEARPGPQSSQGTGSVSTATGSNPIGNSAPAPNQELSTVSTITGLESFLLNRIRDAKKDREALQNMLGAKQLGAAETLAGKMVMTAKYQPELQTVSIQDRQKIRDFYQTVRQLSESINAKNYGEILKLADRLSISCLDIGTEDLKAFAAENRKKALFWIGQAEIARRLGDGRSAQLLLEIAERRAPHEPEVEDSINRIQASGASSLKLKDELAGIIERQDYATAYAKITEFMPLASADENEAQKKALLDLLDKEKSVRTSLEKCESFEKLRAFPEAWLALENVPGPLDKDPRLQEKKNLLTSDCADFIAAYIRGKKFEMQGQSPLALTWYLEALSLTSGNPDVKSKIKELGGKILEVQ